MPLACHVLLYLLCVSGLSCFTAGCGFSIFLKHGSAQLGPQTKWRMHPAASVQWIYTKTSAHILTAPNGWPKGFSKQNSRWSNVLSTNPRLCITVFWKVEQRLCRVLEKTKCYLRSKKIFWPIDGAMACDMVVLFQLLKLNTGRCFAMFNDEILEMEHWNWAYKTLHQLPL